MNSRDPSATLDRHQQRREADLPTVSVLAGPVGLAAREAGRWAEARGRAIVTVDVPRPDAMVDAWAECLASHRDLTRDAVEHLARRAGVLADDLAARIIRMTPMELNLFFESLPPGRDRPGVEVACRWIVGLKAGKLQNTSGFAALLGESIVDRIGDDPRCRAVIALGNLIPPGSGPVLLAARTGRIGWVEATAPILGRLAQLQPRLATILAVEPGELDAYLRLAPESREKALIRSGVVEVTGPDDGARANTVQRVRAGNGRDLSHSLPPCGGGLGWGDVARPETLEEAGFRDGSSCHATPHPNPPPQGGREINSLGAGVYDSSNGIEARAQPPTPIETPEADDEARSAAERFLFESLAMHPQTAGLFELNAAIDIPFGPGRGMEVDLFSRALGIAIEVDGYHHFQDAESYRRDRRKDFLLQSRGYLVIRVLAEDVVPRLEEILALIRSAVASRRGGPKPSNREATP